MHANSSMQILAIETLTHLIQVYPSLHRSLHTGISTMTLQYLNGSSPQPMPPAIVAAASQLYSILHLTGGKVGAANLWRKSFDDTINFSWTSLSRLRTTFRTPGKCVSEIVDDSFTFSDSAVAVSPPIPGPSSEDPVVAISLHLDRLRAGIRVLRDHCR